MRIATAVLDELQVTCVVISGVVPLEYVLSMLCFPPFRFSLSVLVLSFSLVLLAPRLRMLSLVLLLSLLSLLLLHLLLMSLDLRSLFIFLLPLMSQFLSLLLWPGLIALDAPGPLSFPISIIMPAPPVLLKSLVRNPFIGPPVSVPIMVSVVSSPTRVYIKIKTWDSIKISPPAVIIM